MEQLQQLARTKKKIATLIGRIETPLITPKPFFWKEGCLVKLVKEPSNEKRAVYAPLGKLVKGERKAPDMHNGFRGFVRVTAVDYSEEKLKRTMERFSQKRFLGKYRCEGFGRVCWIDCTIKDYHPTILQKRKKFKIRKGLGPNYPEQLQRLLLALMLHDFFHTEKHPSKIYREIVIEDKEIAEACKNHHSSTASNNQYLPLIKKFDAIAAMITRKKYLRKNTRYDKTKGEIDFQALAKEIEERSTSAYKLYNFIYQSNTLTRIVETMSYQKNSLRMHLLLMVNLAVNDYYNKKLKVTKENISVAAKEREELLNAKDAERHRTLTMNKTESENKAKSRKKRYGT